MLRDRARGLGDAIEIGDRVGGFVRRRRCQFIADRSGETFLAPVLASATAATAATASTAARPPFAILALFGAGKARLLVGLLILSEAVVGDASLARLGHGGLHQFVILARLLFAFARLAAATTAATPAPAPPATALAIAFAGFCACGLLVGQAFGFLGLDLGFHLDV